MSKAKNLDGLSPEKYCKWKSKAASIQALKTSLFYDITRQKRTTVTRIFADFVSKNDLVVHIIDSLSLQIVDVPKEPILCNFTTIQNMTQLLRTVFGGYILTNR